MSTRPSPGPSARILVVDDDEALQHAYRAVFEDEGHAVTAWGAPADPAAVATLAPDLVLLDFLIAGTDNGWRFLRSLKANPATAAIPVLVVSAADAVLQRAEEQLAAWDCAVLCKPFDLDELLAAIRHCLRTADAGQTAD